MTYQERYAEARQRAQKCAHPAKGIHYVGNVQVCAACSAQYQAEYAAIRADELRESKPACDRCGKPHAATWNVAEFHLCGRCKTATMREHAANTHRAGALAMSATRPVVNYDDWHTFKARRAAADAALSKISNADDADHIEAGFAAAYTYVANIFNIP